VPTMLFVSCVTERRSPGSRRSVRLHVRDRDPKGRRRIEPVSRLVRGFSSRPTNEPSDRIHSFPRMRTRSLSRSACEFSNVASSSSDCTVDSPSAFRVAISTRWQSMARCQSFIRHWAARRCSSLNFAIASHPQ
jgi:hypothetical protein